MQNKNIRTNADHNPPRIEDLGDGTYYYNFHIEEDKDNKEGNKSWSYDQVRLPYPVQEEAIQQAVNKKGFSHIVKL